MEWFLSSIYQIWLNRGIWLYYGGMISVGVTIFLVGCLKKALLGRVHNELVRKVVVFSLSIVMVAPVTAIYLCFNAPNAFAYFWWLYGFNVAAMLIIYAFYENFLIRNLLELIGKNTVWRIFTALFCKGKKPTVEETVKSIREDTKKIVQKYENKIVKKYDDDDLKNL